ncbi:hypothetical protein [Streptomyces sp. CA-132043]|uniref:hypothetical protein n=1 Tax=Streptomyces sp. CA-132043 TaxID=3240048 RepID=UPI003D8A85BB
MSTPDSRPVALWLRFGGPLLAVLVVLSWLLPLESWLRFLWNMAAAFAAFRLLVMLQARRQRAEREEARR